MAFWASGVFLTLFFSMVSRCNCMFAIALVAGAPVKFLVRSFCFGDWCRGFFSYLTLRGYVSLWFIGHVFVVEKGCGVFLLLPKFPPSVLLVQVDRFAVWVPTRFTGKYMWASPPSPLLMSFQFPYRP